MFIRFFKSNNAIALVVLPIMAVIIWLFGMLNPQVLPVRHTMPLFELIGRGAYAVPWLSVLLGYVLVVSQAFLLNYIVNENEVLKKQSYLPALFYMVFMSNNSAMLMFHPQQFANLFLLFAINKLLSSYRKDQAFSQAFDAGFLLSIASLFYFPYAVFFPVLGIAFILLRPFNWREWFISFLGVITPYSFVIVFYFWNDITDYLWYDKMFYPMVLERKTAEVADSFYLMIGIGWLLILFSFFKAFATIGAGSQRSKKGMSLFIWLFFISVLTIFPAPELSTKYFSAFAIPAAVFCANYFSEIKKEWIGEILFLILIASLFVNLIAFYF
ncbi:MAG: DUF6427 family protein [Bacteroidia bacterium]|nr:DUF6427 family protein [Bacteroidia bacterium]